MSILSEIFSWWGGNTWSNRIYTALRGKLVGTDAAGNRYYVQSKGIGPLGVPRRWVIYREPARKPRRSPRLARLDALHGRYAADRGGLPAAPLAEAAPHEHDGHRRRPIVRAAAFWPAAGVPRPRATTSPGGRLDRSARWHGVTLTPCSLATLSRCGAIGEPHGTTGNAADSRPALPRSRSPAPAGLLGVRLRPAGFLLGARRRAAHREHGRHLRRPRQGDGQDLQARGAAQPDRPSSAPSRSRRAPATRARPPSRPRPPPSWRSTRCCSTTRKSASSQAGCLPTARASTPSSIRCSTSG